MIIFIKQKSYNSPKYVIVTVGLMERNSFLKQKLIEQFLTE